MFTLPSFRRRDDYAADRRTRAGRRPTVEGLEGRQLLSTLTVDTGKKMAPEIKHGWDVDIQGGHVGSVADGFPERHPTIIAIL